jgi:hypothetical protein
MVSRRTCRKQPRNVVEPRDKAQLKTSGNREDNSLPSEISEFLVNALKSHFDLLGFCNENELSVQTKGRC